MKPKTLPELADLIGLEYRTAHMWMQDGLLVASVATAAGSGHPALFNDGDILRAHLLVQLRMAGLSLDGLRQIVNDPVPLLTAVDDWVVLIADYDELPIDVAS